MLNLYYSFVYPYLIYCNHIWGSTYKTNLSKLQVLQNKAVRIITGSPRRTNTEMMYRNNNILKLDSINVYLIGQFMYKIHHKTLPYIFDNFFKHNHHIHDHNTRISSHLNVPQSVSNLSKTGIRIQGVMDWNSILSIGINIDTSELSFKIMLKKCIQQNILSI